MNPTEKLAAFVAETRLNDIPPAVLEHSRLPIIDGVAVTLGGYPPIGEKILEFISELGGRPVSTIAGTGYKTSAPLAAYANGTLAHVLDYDDLNESMGGHPTAPVLSAALAVGEMVQATGKQLLLAYILGVETETKIGRALIKTLYGRGWHPTAILGTLGAAAACSKLLGLDTEKTLMALGIAGSSAGGLKQNFGTPTKPLHVGQAAKNGVLAAMLAQKDWVADRSILEGHFGFCNLFCGPNSYDLSEMTEYLGNPWEISDPGIKLKKYPCCGSIHPALDAVFGLPSDTRLRPDQIERVDCSVYPSKTHILIHPRPVTGLEAKFSIEYCLAAALTDKHLCLSHFSDETVRQKKFEPLLVRIHATTDPSLPEWGCRVQIKSMDGSTVTGECIQLMGIETQDDLRSKFFDCAVPVLGPEKTVRVFDTLQHFEGIENISEMMDLLVGDQRPNSAIDTFSKQPSFN